MDSNRQTSPFASLDQQDVESILLSCPALVAPLRDVLSDERIRFCSEHRSADSHAQMAWRLHAALLNVLLHPLADLFKRASDAAIEAFYPSQNGELELAFRDGGRDAYVWLQCLLSEELVWCTSIGCPTCSTTRVLSSETTIRAVLTAALYSAFSNTLSIPTPNFRPILPAVRTAICSDPFWTPNHYPHFLSRSQTLASGLRDLHVQVLEIEIATTSPPSSDSSTDSTASFSEIRENSPKALARIKPSKMARRQMRLREEEGVMTASMLRRFREAEEQRDRRMVDEKKARKKGASGLLRTKSSASLI